MIALLLAAQIAAAAPTPVASETPNLFRDPTYCRNLGVRTVDRNWRAVPEPLNRQPVAQVELAVDRQIGACHVRTVVRQVDEQGDFVLSVPTAPVRPEGGRSRRR